MRTMMGYAVLAVIGVLALKLVFGLLSFAISIAVTLLIWAAIGFGFYLLLKVISPDTARRVRELINGKPPAPAA